ncbi:MAG: hypothetical protein V1817_01120 [Candidatus Micrarchaeota archaeon]
MRLKNFSAAGAGALGGKRVRRSRAQAAIFDGITFLLMVGFSCALVYSTITTYGDSLDNALYSFYEINYLQSAVKSLYYINLQQVAGIASSGDADDIGAAYLTNPPLNHGTLGCRQFADYTGSVTVLDLVKKDLSDNQNNPKPAPGSPLPRLDDRFWSDPDKPNPTTPGVSAPGKQALRCALRETMRPLVLAGYDYYAEIVNPSYETDPYKAIEVVNARVTSNESMSDPTKIQTFTAFNSQGSGCLYAQSPAGGSHKVSSMTVPLRISLGNACANAPCERDYVLRICVWQKS